MQGSVRNLGEHQCMLESLSLLGALLFGSLHIGLASSNSKNGTQTS